MLNTWYHFLIGKHILVHRFFFLVIIFEGFLAILDTDCYIFGHILTFFGLDTFQFFKRFSGSRNIPKEFQSLSFSIQSFVVFLIKLENNICKISRVVFKINKPKLFSNFSCMFLNPNDFSNSDSNFSNLFDMRKLQEQVKKAFCYQ